MQDWAKLPLELRQRPQWAVAGADKSPMVANGSGLRRTSVTSPGDWITFQEAWELAYLHREMVTTTINSSGVTKTQTGLNIGYILNEADPYTCIDLDVKDITTHPGQPDMWSTMDDFNRYMSIVNVMDSYTERSLSTKGLHIWVKGDIGRGYRRDGVEIYSRERFIICTGDPYINKPIRDCQDILENMIAQMRPLQKEIELEELPEELQDWYVLQMAINASNGDKFTDLWNGHWEKYGFPSQSEADLALLSMFTFYSDCNEQCRRLFRESKLGRREKALKDDRYLNYTLKLIRNRQADERSANIDGIVNKAEQFRLAQQGIAEMQGGAAPAPMSHGLTGPLPSVTAKPLHVTGQGDPQLGERPAESQLAMLAPVNERVFEADKDGLKWPPGNVGKLAQYLFNNSYLPIKEVAIASALGFFAGVCGKVWHIPKSGLNLYIVLVARSAIGKEALQSGLADVVSQLMNAGHYYVSQFINFTKYASGPALIKACAQQTSFVNVNGEWGRLMKRIAMEDDRDGPMTTLRTEMTHLYQKSAPTSIAGGISYSSSDNNIEAFTSVAYSLVGESTPQTYFESLTDSMMEDGFLSRFLVIQYEGDRPDENEIFQEMMDPALLKSLGDICSIADKSLSGGHFCAVERTEEAAQILSAFNKEMVSNIRSTDDESRRQMWNRAQLKVLRVAALLAVGGNHLQPCIKKEEAEWAIDLIRRDISLMRKRIDSGDVGLGDKSRERKMVSILVEYLRKRPGKSYAVNDEMYEWKVVPRKYLQVRCNQSSAFYKYRFGGNRALDETIKHMIDNGVLKECPASVAVDKFGFHGKCYYILTNQLPDYGDE